MARRPAGVQVDEALVGAAPEPEGQVLQLLHEPAVHQHVQQGQHLVRHLPSGVAGGSRQLLVGEAGKAPDGLFRQLPPHPAEKGHQGPLVGRLEGLPAQQGQAVDVAGGQEGKEVVLRLSGEGLTVGEIPGLGLEAVLAAVGTAGDKQADPNSLAVGNVAVFDLAVVQGALLSSRKTAPAGAGAVGAIL